LISPELLVGAVATFVGSAGGPATTVVGLVAVSTEPSPEALKAATVVVYATPDVKPVTVHVSAEVVQVRVVPDVGVAVTV
jgi:hypothetical protein